jgi:hypothetical protein
MGHGLPPAGGFLVALQDTNGDGRADVNIRFGDTPPSSPCRPESPQVWKRGSEADADAETVA